MSITKEKKQELMEQYGQHEGDNGSAEVQIAILTERISNITEHLEDHKHDNSSRRGLKTLVNRRRKLLDYLKDNDEEKYKEIISELGIRK